MFERRERRQKNKAAYSVQKIWTNVTSFGGIMPIDVIFPSDMTSIAIVWPGIATFVLNQPET